jgi:hypothetical protein
VHDDVDAAVDLLGAIEQRPDLVLVGDVRADRGGGAAGGGDGADRLLGGVGVAGKAQDHSHAVGGEALGDRAADAAGRAGHDRNACVFGVRQGVHGSHRINDTFNT